MIQKNKIFVLAAFSVFIIVALFVFNNAVNSQNQKTQDCKGKGQVIVLDDTKNYQIHVVYDFEVGKVTTVKVYKDVSLSAGTISKMSVQNLR